MKDKNKFGMKSQLASSSTEHDQIFGQNIIHSNPAGVMLYLEVGIDSVIPHPKIAETRGLRKIDGLKLTMKIAGQLEPIKVIESGSQYLIVDGICRYHAAKELRWKTIKIEILNDIDDQVQEQMVFRNFNTKRTYKELISNAEIVLGILGKSQGKRRDVNSDPLIEGMELNIDGKDRFQIACEILNLEFSATTLRRLIAVKEFEESEINEMKKFRFLDKIQTNEMTINSAFTLICKFQTESKEFGKNALEEINNEDITENSAVFSKPAIVFSKKIKDTSSLNYHDYCSAKNENKEQLNEYTLINGTCKDLSLIDDDSIQCVVTSPPYYQLRCYDQENGYKSELGQEATVEEYVQNQVEIFSNVRRKLKKEGSLFVIIADSYKGTSLLVTQKFVVEMCNSGWYLNSEIIWRKSNPKPHCNIKRLQPTYEKIFHFVKDPSKAFFRDFKNWDPSGKFEITKGCNDHSAEGKTKKMSWTLKRPYQKFKDFLNEQDVENVLTSNSFKWSELKNIDPNFKHEAPYSITIPLLPILLTTQIGDKVLDIYNGTGTTVAAAVALKRVGIGIEIDKNAFDFSVKRMIEAVKDSSLTTINDFSDFENEYFVNKAA